MLVKSHSFVFFLLFFHYCSYGSTNGYELVFNNNDYIIPTAPLLEQCDRDLELKLEVHGLGNIENNDKIICNKLVVDCTISGMGNIKIVREELLEEISINHPKKATEKLKHVIDKLSNVSMFANKCKRYDIIHLNAKTYRMGSITFHVICKEIEWKKVKSTDMGRVYYNNQNVGEIDCNDKANLFYFCTENGNFRFTYLSYSLGIIFGLLALQLYRKKSKNLKFNLFF